MFYFYVLFEWIDKRVMCARSTYGRDSRSTSFHLAETQPACLPAMPRSTSSSKGSPNANIGQRQLSAGSLKERLSKLATPLQFQPVVALQANIECVAVSWVLQSSKCNDEYQLRTSQNSAKAEIADDGGSIMGGIDACICVAVHFPMVRMYSWFGLTVIMRSFWLNRSIPPIWPLLIIYLIWIMYIDGSPEHGGRRSPWFRSLIVWKYFGDYFPASWVAQLSSMSM